MIIVIRLADFQMHLLLQHKGQRLGGGGKGEWIWREIGGERKFSSATLVGGGKRQIGRENGIPIICVCVCVCVCFLVFLKQNLM